MDAYYCTPVGPFHVAAGAAFSTFTTRQDVSPQPVPVLAPNQLHLGSKVLIMAEGEYSSLTGAVLTLGFYLGTNVAPPAPVSILAESSAITTGTTPTAWAWRMEYRGTVVALGPAGSIVGQGDLELGTSLTALTTSPMPITQALRTVAFDSTIVRSAGVCATYGASSASNIVKTNGLYVLLAN